LFILSATILALPAAGVRYIDEFPGAPAVPGKIEKPIIWSAIISAAVTANAAPAAYIIAGAS
jgi:hypothetical protein